MADLNIEEKISLDGDPNAAKQHKETEDNFAAFGDSIDATTQSLKDLKQNLNQQKQQVEDANADNMAAEADGVISVSDALKMIDNEQAAKDTYHQQAAKYLKTSAEAFTSTIVNGTSMTLSMLDDGLKTIDFGNGMPNGLKTAAKTICLTGAAAALLPDGELQDMALNALSGFSKCQNENEIDPDVEEKYIEGQESPEAYADSYYQDTIDTGENYDQGSVGSETTEEKEIISNENYVAPSENEATTISQVEIDEMADLDGYLDKMVNVLEKSDSVVNQVLAKSISALEASDFGQVIEEKIESVMSGKKAQLFAKRDEMDAKETEQVTDDIEYGG